MHLLDLFFPKFCVGCGKIGAYFCASCIKLIRPILQSETICPVCERSAIDGKTHPFCQTRYSLDGLICFFHYKNPLKNAIKKIKYQFVSDIVVPCVDLSTQIWNLEKSYNHLLNGAVLIPSPLHISRKRFRGFNQAELIGKQLANTYKIPLHDDMIQRIRVTTPQVEVRNRKNRVMNMKGVFMIKRPIHYDIPHTVLFVDDVFTTGATMKEATKVLKYAGVTCVWGIALAR